MKNYIVIITIMVLVVCSSCTVKTAILARPMDGSKPLIGEAVATLSKGTFSASNTEGLVCEGQYDQWETSPRLDVNVRCNDGRFGKVVVLRSGEYLTNGSGEGELNDGTLFRVYMGEQATQKIWDENKSEEKTIIK